MMKKLSRLVLSIFLLFLNLSSSYIAHAAPQEISGENKFDLLFLIDRSGSMGGDPSYSNPNDPLGLRFFAPIFAMQWMGSDHLLIHNNVDYRMAVIHFGSNTETVLNWEDVSPATKQEWDITRSNLLDKLKPGELTDIPLRNTNFISAFDSARTMFHTNENTEIESDRKKVIIVLTDGAPTEGPPSTEKKENDFSISDHMRAVESIVKNDLSLQDNYSIYVIALEDASNDTWSIMKPYWDQITDGNAFQAKSEEEIGAYIQEILIEQTNAFTQNSDFINEQVSPGRVLIKPFLQNMTLTFFKSSLAQKFSILLPDGTELTNSETEYEYISNEGPIEIISIKNPPSGYWTVTSQISQPVEIRLQQVFGDLTMVMPQGELTQYVPIPIEFSILGVDGLEIPSYDAPLDLLASVTVNGEVTSLNFEQNNNDYYSTIFTPTKIGEHIFEFDFSFIDGSGEKTEIFKQQYTLNAQKPTITMVNPIENTDVFKAIDIQLSLRDTYNRLIKEFPADLNCYIVLGRKKIPLELNFDGEKFVVNFLPLQSGNYEIILEDTENNKIKIAEFNVLDPEIKIKNIEDYVYAYSDIALSLFVEGQDGSAPSWYSDENTLFVDARVDDKSVSIKKIGENEFFISYHPEDTGFEKINIFVGVKNSDGDIIYELLNKNIEFEVKNSNPVTIRTPHTERFAWRSVSLVSPFLQPREWQIVLELVDSQGNPLGLDEITLQDPSLLFDIDISNKNIQISNIKYSGNGELLVSGIGLSKGEYELTIVPKQVLLPSYVWIDTPIHINLNLVENPIITILQIALLLILLTVLFFVVKKILSWYWSKQACTGTIAIKDINKRILWSKNLEKQKSGYIVFRKKEMGILPIKKMTIINIKDFHNGTSAIRIRYILNGGGVKTITMDSSDSQKIKSTDLSLFYFINSELDNGEEGDNK